MCLCNGKCVCGAERVGDGEQRMREQACVCDPRPAPRRCRVPVPAGAGWDSPSSESGEDTPAFRLTLPVQSPSARSAGKDLSQILQRGGGGISPDTSNIQDH